MSYRRRVVALFLTLLLLPATLPAHPPGEDAGHRHDEANSTVFTTRPESHVLPPTKPDDAFQFAIFGDRTGGVPAGLKVLRQATEDVQLLDPDLVMTVGDLIQGYNQTPQWLEQAAEYREIMDDLPMPWFPVAGNHDIYWRGPGPAPQGHHEASYEQHFGPLWYSFRHKDTGFIVMYSDEGNPTLNLKDFNTPMLQQVSEAQKSFLVDALERLKNANHVFVFLHHPRWIEARYGGSGWENIHEMFREAGNVHAVFAGHIHEMQYGGVQDGIAYYALATTGGHLSADIPGAGYLHHFNLVTVRPQSFLVTAIPVGAVMDPRKFTDEFREQVDLAMSIRPKHQSGDLQIAADGSIDGTVTYKLNNPCRHEVRLATYLNLDDTGWVTDFDHQHQTLLAGASHSINVTLAHPDASKSAIPTLVLQPTLLAEDAAIDLPISDTPMPISLNKVPANFFTEPADNRALRVRDEASAVRLDASEFELPLGPFTLEAWIRPSGKSGYQGVIAKTQSSDYAFFFDEGLIDFSVHLGGKYVSTRNADPLPTDRLVHVAGVRDAEELRLYVDGKLVDRTPCRGQRKRNRLPMWIGADPDGRGEASRPFDGWIDEVRLTSRAVYDGPTFQPETRMKRDDDTVLLFHFDRRFGPFLLSESAQPAKALLGRKSELVEVR